RFLVLAVRFLVLDRLPAGRARVAGFLAKACFRSPSHACYRLCRTDRARPRDERLAWLFEPVMAQWTPVGNARHESKWPPTTLLSRQAVLGRTLRATWQGGRACIAAASALRTFLLRKAAYGAAHDSRSEGGNRLGRSAGGGGLACRI